LTTSVVDIVSFSVADSEILKRGGGGRRRVSLVVIYGRCTQRTMCLWYRKRRLIEKKMSANRGTSALTAPSLPFESTTVRRVVYI